MTITHDHHATTSAPGRPAELARVCVVCLWRELPDERERVCWPCETRMERHLDLLGRIGPLLAAVAHTEPTARGELHIPLVDLAARVTKIKAFANHEDQIGGEPVMALLAFWVRVWGGAISGRVGAWSLSRQLLDELPHAAAERLDIGQFATELRQAYATVRRALQRDLRPVSYAVPCPGCGAESLERLPGDWIRCGSCERLWDDPDLEQVNWAEAMHLRQLADPWAVLDTAQAAMYAGVAPATIRSWVNRGQLASIPGTAELGRRRFWLIDVDHAQALLEHAARERAERALRKLQERAAGGDHAADAVLYAVAALGTVTA